MSQYNNYKNNYNNKRSGYKGSGYQATSNNQLYKDDLKITLKPGPLFIKDNTLSNYDKFVNEILLENVDKSNYTNILISF